MVYILNTPILTEYGTYSFRKAESLDYVKGLLDGWFISAIGHEGTAKVLSVILDMQIPVNRTAIRMQKGDVVVVFRVLERLPEGKVLSKEELKAIPYELGILIMM